eukprot:g13284.t1
MYAGEDGEVCVELGYVGKEISASKGNHPDKSKAGGWPAWFGEAPVDVGGLVCRLCGRYLYLVIQIYAPTHVQRSLCVFGCNRAACSLRPEAWRVIRTQERSPADPTLDKFDAAKPRGDISSGTTVAAATRDAGGGMPPPTPLHVPAQAVVQPAPDAWGTSDVSWDAVAAPNGDGWGAEESEWGAAVGIEGVGDEATPDISALLEEQENKRSSKAQEHQAAPPSPPAAAGHPQDGDALDQPTRAGSQAKGSSARQRCLSGASGADATVALTTSAAADEAESGGGRPRFPAKTVSFMPEPWGADSSRANDKEMEDRLRRYREQEEDRGLVTALDQALGLKDGCGAGNGGGQQGEGDGVAGIGEKYERTPARAKAVLRFADRVARSPQQVVRYAYGGLPLWSSSDPPREDVPPCACGAARLFEMQLMPALLLQLQVNNLAGQQHPAEQEKASSRVSGEAQDDVENPRRLTPSSAANQAGAGGASVPSADRSINLTGAAQEDRGDSSALRGLKNKDIDREEGGEVEAVVMPTPSAEDLERLRTWGMDWGVVGVWSCPGSCDVSCEECVVVQLPV